MNPFFLDLALSFFVGGLWVTLASVAAQRFGGKIGGFIAGLPSTSVLAIFFITYSEGAAHAHELTGVFPITIAINAPLLAVFAACSKNHFSSGLLACMMFWAVAQTLVFFFHGLPFPAAMALGIFLFLTSAWAAGRLRIPAPHCKPARHGPWEMMVRALCGGGIVVLSMTGSHLSGPVLGGILSAFPATALATLVITAIYGGTGLARTMARPMMVSGVINALVFVLVYRHVVLHLHVLAALGAAYGVTMLSAACTFWWMNVHHKEPARSIHT